MENGEAEPQSALRKRSQSAGTTNGAITCLSLLKQSKKAPSIALQSPSSQAFTSWAEPTRCRRERMQLVAVADPVLTGAAGIAGENQLHGHAVRRAQHAEQTIDRRRRR